MNTKMCALVILVAGLSLSGCKTMEGSSAVAPPAATGVGSLNVGNVTAASGSNFRVDLSNPTTAGTTYDQLVSSGTVNLGGSTPQVVLGNTYSPTLGDTPLSRSARITPVPATDIAGSGNLSAASSVAVSPPRAPAARPMRSSA